MRMMSLLLLPMLAVLSACASGGNVQREELPKHFQVVEQNIVDPLLARTETCTTDCLQILAAAADASEYGRRIDVNAVDRNPDLVLSRVNAEISINNGAAKQAEIAPALDIATFGVTSALSAYVAQGNRQHQRRSSRIDEIKARAAEIDAANPDFINNVTANGGAGGQSSSQSSSSSNPTLNNTTTASSNQQLTHNPETNLSNQQGQGQHQGLNNSNNLTANPSAESTSLVDADFLLRNNLRIDANGMIVPMPQPRD